MPISIEVKNLKYAAFASEETHCYSATIYVDGKRFCTGRNDGHGGCDMYDAIGDGDVYADIKKVDARIKKERASEFKTHTREDGSTFEIGPDFEWMVCDAVNDALTLRDMKAALRKHWIYTKPDEDGLWQAKRLKQHTVEEAVETYKKMNPGGILLQGLPEAEALKMWKANGS